jgi:hypothetical protein
MAERSKIVSSLEILTRNCDVELIKNFSLFWKTEGHLKGVSEKKLHLSNVKFMSLFES